MGFDNSVVPRLTGVYKQVGRDSNGMLIIDQSANFIGFLEEGVYLVGKVTGSTYDGVTNFSYFQASGDAYDTGNSTSLTFSISDGVTNEDRRMRGLEIDLSDGRTIIIDAFSNRGGLIRSSWTDEYELLATELTEPLGFRVVDESQEISTATTFPSVCDLDGTIVRNNSESWVIDLSVTGEQCPYSDDYIGIGASENGGNFRCRDQGIFNQIALFNEERNQFIMGCLRNR